jgi:HK97 family phage portal protein
MSALTSIASFLGFGAKEPAKGKKYDAASASRTARPVSFDSAMSVTAVYACIRLISETVASLPLRLYRLGPDGSRLEIKTHPVMSLLRNRPNANQTRVEFFEHFMLNLVSSGNAYCLRGYSDPAKKRLVSLQVINSGSMAVNVMSDGTRLYKWTDNNGVKNESLPVDIWHVRLFGTGVVGLSPLSAAAKAIGAGLAADDRVSDLIGKGVPQGILTTSGAPTADQRDMLRDETARMMTGESIPVFPDGLKFTGFTLTPADLELLATRRFTTEEIGRVFGVPSVLINDTASSTVWGSGINEIISGFYKFNLRAYLEKIEESMRINLLASTDWDKYEFEFDVDAILRASKSARVDMGVKEVNGGLLTTNEYRKNEGLPPVAGGDRIRVALNLATIDEVGNIVPAQSKQGAM